MNCFCGICNDNGVLDYLKVKAFLIIHSFDKYLNSAYRVPSTVLGPEDSAVSNCFCFYKAYIRLGVGKIQQKNRFYIRL